MPRAHHKFVVFCKGSAQPDQGVWVVGERPFQPYAVWTGSFNFTKNAAQSFENAVVLTDPTVVRAFEREHAQIAALSEPLDWRTEWVEPEWRIGTQVQDGLAFVELGQQVTDRHANSAWVQVLHVVLSWSGNGLD